MNTKNHRAIVVGATSGIGLEVARLLAERGWTVGVAGRRGEVLEALVANSPNIVHWREIDVTKADAGSRLMELVETMGGMDLYFHSSGIGYQNASLDETKELSTIETNCMGMSRMVGEAFRYFAERPDHEGHIAVISSIACPKGLGAAPAYSSSKRFTSHYLECLTQLAAIRGLHHLTVTDIRPGFVRTPLIAGSPFPYQLDVRSVAHGIVRAIERKKKVVTINWVYRLLVFFWQMIPRWVWVRMKIGR